MKRKRSALPRTVKIDSIIRLIRDERVILDSDPARAYGIPTSRLNEAVNRNRERFPEDFLFRLTQDEFTSLISQIAISNRGRGGRRTLPLALTEHGAVMAANILNGDRAVQRSIFLVRAFIKMRQTLATTAAMTETLNALEKKLAGRLDVHEKAIVFVLDELRKLMQLGLGESLVLDRVDTMWRNKYVTDRVCIEHCSSGFDR